MIRLKDVFNTNSYMILKLIKKNIACYGVRDQSGFLAWMLGIVISCITGYNHKKYWHRREYVVNCQKGFFFKKLFYLLYIKRVDARHLSSTGTMLNIGNNWIAPPNLPHGLNRIIIGHDAKIGRNVTIFQGVTVSHGGCSIGDNVLLGANCVILSGVHVGNNAKIGANCVVVNDVPDGATCVIQKPRIIMVDKDTEKVDM